MKTQTQLMIEKVMNEGTVNLIREGTEEEKIVIKPSPTADTRTATEPVSKDELLKSSKMHISDVKKCLGWFINKLKNAADKHDWTKIEYIDDFHKDFTDQQAGKLDFIDGKWYKTHVNEERHHVNERCPEDVNLIDLLEHLADCACAGMARSGSVYPDSLDPKVLSRAYENTLKLFVDNIEVKDEA